MSALRRPLYRQHFSESYRQYTLRQYPPHASRQHSLLQSCPRTYRQSVELGLGLANLSVGFFVYFNVTVCGCCTLKVIHLGETTLPTVLVVSSGLMSERGLLNFLAVPVL